MKMLFGPGGLNGYPDWEIFESPNAKIDLNRIQRWINERHTHHGESCNGRYSSALA
jgi:hypothetical protein